MSINLKCRLKNPVFIAQVGLSILTPIIGYAGIKFEDITSWPLLGEMLLQAISNPYVVVLILVSVWNAINDPTTSGVMDSTLANTYTCPKKKGE